LYAFILPWIMYRSEVFSIFEWILRSPLKF
jgi:hypothetical protein